MTQKLCDKKQVRLVPSKCDTQQIVELNTKDKTELIRHDSLFKWKHLFRFEFIYCNIEIIDLKLIIQRVF